VIALLLACGVLGGCVVLPLGCGHGYERHGWDRR